MRRLLLPGPGALCALAVALPVALSYLKSYDLFFNLASGRWILEHGFPARDPFSITAAGPWFPHEWGFGVLAELSVRLLGGCGPAILAALILAASILLLWRAVVSASGRGGLAPLFLFLLALGAQSFSWEDQRAYQPGDLLFVLSVLLVQRFRRETSSGHEIFLLLPLTLLWANLHGSWPASVLLLSAVVCGRALDRGGLDRRGLTGAAAALGAFLVAALSPEGLGTLAYPFRFLIGGHTASIFEWQALELSQGDAQAFLALVLIFVFALGRASLRSLALVIPTSGLAVAAVLAERFTPMAAVLLSVSSAELLSSGPAPRTSRALSAAWSRLDGWVSRFCARAGGALWPFAGLAVVAGLALANPVPLEERMDPGYFPIKALKTLRTLGPGRVLNRYHLGGAVSAVCGPDYKVFIDGRNDLFPKAVHRDYRRLVLVEPGYQEALERYAPRYLLWSRINHGSSLLEVLRLQGGFRPLVDEEAGMLWVREESSR